MRLIPDWRFGPWCIELLLRHLRGNDLVSLGLALGTMYKVLPWGKVITCEGTGCWLTLEGK